MDLNSLIAAYKSQPTPLAQAFATGLGVTLNASASASALTGDISS